MTNTLMTLDTALQDLITGAVAAAETAGGFVAEEAPIVVEQLLVWNFTASLILFSILVLGVPCAVFAVWKCLKHFETVEVMIVAAIVGLLSAIGAPAIVTASGMAGPLVWLKIAIAPKLYLLEYAADLIK